MTPRIQYEVILANQESEFGYNLYTPRYGDTFVGNYLRYWDAVARAVHAAGPDEVAVVDENHGSDGATVISIVKREV